MKGDATKPQVTAEANLLPANGSQIRASLSLPARFLSVEWIPPFPGFVGIPFMNRTYRRSDGYALRMIHNVRPAVELPGASMWPALVVTFGILITAAALLVLLLGG